MALFDRFLFAFTIGSHIILVASSISLILLLLILEILHTRKENPKYETLIHRLRKLFIVSFGIGTASGIVQAVLLINLFPGFMTIVSKTGAIALFYAEIFTFFLETVTLGIYIYYDGVFKWKYTNVVLSFFLLLGTLLSAVFITMVNAWMNTPNGFNIQTYLTTGAITNVNPWAPFATPSTLSEILHVITSTVLFGFMMFGAFFAVKYLRTHDENEKSLASSMLHIIGVVSIIDVILVGLTGSLEASTVLLDQPLKFAALELDYMPGTHMAEHIFGTLVFSHGTYHVVGGWQISGLQSFLAGTQTQLPGLNQYPHSLWPPLFVHTSFDTMVTGGLIIGLFLFIMFIIFVVKRDPVHYKPMLYFQIIAGFLTGIVYELGWVTDEVGRQPWVIYGVQKTKAAINPSPGLLGPGYFIIAFYLVLVPVTFYFYSRLYNKQKEVKNMNEALPEEGGVNY